MSDESTLRISVKPETQDAHAVQATPPTERISADSAGESKTVRIVPGEHPNFENPVSDKIFDQYTIYSKIGDGGMGVVYLARDRGLGRFVAIKRLNRQAQRNPSLRQRFLHEARAVATLSHVHIVHIYALGDDEDGPFIVMEYVAGPDDPTIKPKEIASGLTQPNAPLTLDKMITQKGPLMADEAIDLILKIGRAVAYAHTCGVIHRDLKPSNILLDKSNEPKIVDFGLARLMHKEESQLTVPGEKLLSLGYGAPEQESDASLSDERADVYGLGALLYFTLTGQNPRYFREQDIPSQLRDVVSKALATDREQRWKSANAFNEALINVQNRTRVEVPTVKTTWRCKWCDAINPLTTKFCAECGWDGSEKCPECGADTFIGIQYCQNCGADARAYETLLHILSKMREALSNKRYEQVVASAGRVHGFDPTGPAGRKYLAEMIELRKKAEEALRKRDQLLEQIPIELNAENFERAEVFIKRYREISGDRHAFEHETNKIPSQILNRDLVRAKRALKNKEWGSAALICNDLLSTIAPENPDLLAIRRAIRRHDVSGDALKAILLFLCLILAYILGTPLAARLDTPPTSRTVKLLFTPGYMTTKIPGFGAYYTRYADSVMQTNRTFKGWFAEGKSKKPQSILPPAPPPDSMKEKQTEYAAQLKAIMDEREVFLQAWPEEYLLELEKLMEERRTAGDFEGWEITQIEYDRFKMERVLAEEIADEKVAPELAALQRRCRQMQLDQKVAENKKLVALGKRYINDLSDMLKIFMSESKMDLAAAIHAEIRKTKDSLKQVDTKIGQTVATNPQATDSTHPQFIPNKIEELESMRSSFEEKLSQSRLSSNQENERWPDQYISGLNQLMDSFQEAGDFSGWEGVKDEANRFEVDRLIKIENISTDIPELEALQRRFIKIKNEIRIAHAKRTVKLAGNYLKQLESLQKRLTVKRQMEAAASVNAEIKSLENRSEYISAQKLLAPEGPPLPPDWEKPAEETL